MSDERRPFYVSCKPCGHIWIAVYVPMELSKFARVLEGMRCPQCASTSRQHFAYDHTPAAASVSARPRQGDKGSNNPCSSKQRGQIGTPKRPEFPPNRVRREGDLRDRKGG